MKQNPDDRIAELKFRDAIQILNPIESVELEALKKNRQSRYVYLKIREHLKLDTIDERAEASVLEIGGSTWHAMLARRKALGTISQQEIVGLEALEFSGGDINYANLAMTLFGRDEFNSSYMRCKKLEYDFIRSAIEKQQ